MSSPGLGDADGPGAAVDRGGGVSLVLADAGKIGAQRVVRLAGDVALEAGESLRLALALGGSPLCVGARAGAVAQAVDGDQRQRRVAGDFSRPGGSA
jgi:hypothetical protein